MAKSSTSCLRRLLKGNKAQLVYRSTSERAFSSHPVSQTDFTHAIIGGGAVGLAIARHLSHTHPDSSTLLVERHGLIGSETSSRNSEVIHAGLYYGHNTLKTQLCISGREQLYALCQKHGIPHRNTRKWIVAQDSQQMHELEKVHRFASEVGSARVPTRFLSAREIAAREPDVRADAGVLESASTGIVDSHAFMQFLEAEFLHHGGTMALHTAVTRIEKTAAGSYRLFFAHTSDSAGSETAEDAVEVETVINSAGLAAIPLSNSLLPPHRHITPHYAKGTYFSYASARPKPNTLLYPAPVPGHGGLGTHLTLDMAGRIRFGPDVEWIDSPDAPGALVPSASRLREAIDMIATYLPGVDRGAITLDYCGIRPKLGRTSGTAGPTFADFYIREEGDVGFPGFVNLLGIESPGLTSSLAIAEFVENLLYGSGGEGGTPRIERETEDVEEAKRRGREGQERSEFHH